MDNTSQIVLADRTGISRSIAKAGVFQSGSIMRIKVLELNGNRALIDFGSGRTTADIKIPVRVGEELLVRVQESATQPKLELFAADPASSSGNEVMGSRTPTVDPDSRQIISSRAGQSESRPPPNRSRSLHSVSRWLMIGNPPN